MTATEFNLLERLYEAALPPHVKAVGVTRHNGQLALLVVTDEREGLAAFSTAELLPRSLQGLPVVLRHVPGRLHAAAYLPSGQNQALTPEQEELNPVVLGAQVQNGAADERQGGYGVGTLGAFARDADGNTALLSNNHVIAAENDAVVGDAIYQAQRDRGRVVATLAAWVPISLSSPNCFDIASATLNADTAFQNAFLPLRNRPKPAGVVAPRVGAKVFKVGRTSGLTFGSVTAIAARVPSVGYGIGSAAFEGSVIIEGQGAAPSVHRATAAAASLICAAACSASCMRVTAPSPSPVRRKRRWTPSHSPSFKRG